MALATDTARDVRPKLLAEAHAAVRSQLSVVVERETVALSSARSRILAVGVVAGIDLPPRDCSAVDGFALRATDLEGDGAVRLRLVGEAAAGHPFGGSVGPGQAIRILTGAPLPDGADTIVMQEFCFADGDLIGVRGDVKGKRHWRQRGEDVSTGSEVLPAGRRLRTQDIALAGALGCRKLSVFKRLRVGLFSTGDELREPGEALGSGQIWDANRCLLRGLLEQMGCEVHDLGILRDEPRLVERALSSAAHDCDLLVTSGGMSVGREDHIRTIIGRRGTLDVWPLAIRPGRPVGLGDIDACPILALPGNPIAAVVTLIAFGRSVVDQLAGAVDQSPASLAFHAGFTFEKKKGARQYLLANIERGRSGASTVVPTARQGAAMLSIMAEMSGFIVLPEDCERVRLGDVVEFAPLNGFLG